MDDVKESIIQHCLNLLKRPDVKDELKAVMRPVIDLLLQQITPYIYLSITFVFISFLLILGIFILLLRNKFVFKET
jgi:hypothetical protein